MSYVLALALAMGGDPVAGDQGVVNRNDAQGAGMTGQLDGQWALMYAERDGHRIDVGGNGTATFRNGLLTVNMEGREQRWHLDIGPGHSARLAPEDQGGGAGTGGGTGTGRTGSTTGGSGSGSGTGGAGTGRGGSGT